MMAITFLESSQAVYSEIPHSLCDIMCSVNLISFTGFCLYSHDHHDKGWCISKEGSRGIKSCRTWFESHDNALTLVYRKTLSDSDARIRGTDP